MWKLSENKPAARGAMRCAGAAERALFGRIGTVTGGCTQISPRAVAGLARTGRELAECDGGRAVATDAAGRAVMAAIAGAAAGAVAGAIVEPVAAACCLARAAATAAAVEPGSHCRGFSGR